MKFTLISCFHGHRLTVFVRRGMEAKFLDLFNNKGKAAALDAVISDTYYCCCADKCIKPTYISKHTANRIATFFGTQIDYFTDIILDYANR